MRSLCPDGLNPLKKQMTTDRNCQGKYAKAFDLLQQLIQQVVLAIAASHGANKQEIQTAIKDRIGEEDQKRRKEAEKKRASKFEKGSGGGQGNGAIRKLTNKLEKVRKHRPFCYLEKTFSLGAKISTSYMSN